MYIALVLFGWLNTVTHIHQDSKWWFSFHAAAKAAKTTRIYQLYIPSGVAKMTKNKQLQEISGIFIGFAIVCQSSPVSFRVVTFNKDISYEFKTNICFERLTWAKTHLLMATYWQQISTPPPTTSYLEEISSLLISGLSRLFFGFENPMKKRHPPSILHPRHPHFEYPWQHIKRIHKGLSLGIFDKNSMAGGV